MRKFVTLLCSIYLLLLPSLLTVVEARAVKGVRGTPPRRLKEDKDKDKKSDKKGDKEAAEPLAASFDEEEIEDRDGEIDERIDPLDCKEKKSGKTHKSEKTKKSKKSKKEKSKHKSKDAKEAKCAEDREGSAGDDEIQVGGMRQSLDGVDCQAIANDEGPTNHPSISFLATMDILKEDSARMGTVYTAMERALQRIVAPGIAGCRMNGNSRFLQSSSSSSSSGSAIVNVDFRPFEFDNQGCDSDLNDSRVGVCLASGVPVDVYYTGEEPASLRSTVQRAIDNYDWGVDGVIETSEVEVTEVARRGASSTGDSDDDSGGGIPPGALGAIGAVAVLALGGGGYYYMRNSGDGEKDKDEPDTDPDTDDEKHNEKDNTPTVYAQPVYDN